MNAKAQKGLSWFAGLAASTRTILLLFGISSVTSLVTFGRDMAGWLVQPTIDSTVQASEERTAAAILELAALIKEAIPGIDSIANKKARENQLEREKTEALKSIIYGGRKP